MSQSLDLRFTDPAAPLFIDLEGDNVETLFVISTSQVHGASTTAQRTGSQIPNMKKRERSESETPRIRKPMKAVQPTDPETYNHHSNNTSRATSRAPGTMPPPSIVPNRSTFHGAASQSLAQNLPPQQGGPSRPKEPLFLPSSQLSAAEEEVLLLTGLGIENMNEAELTEMLEGEGEEVDFSHVSQPSLGMHSYVQSQGVMVDNEAMQVDEADSLELVNDPGLPATQSTFGSDKVYSAIFSLQTPSHIQSVVIPSIIRRLMWHVLQKFG